MPINQQALSKNGEAALQYAALGWHVIPLWWADGEACACPDLNCRKGIKGKSPAKHPIGKIASHGQHSATTNADVIRRWWAQYPNANVGIYLQQSGLCAVDIDPRNGGSETIEDIEREHGPLESDVLAFTGGSGEHRVFEAPVNLNLPGKLGPGIDMKLDGYIVVEPSNHVDGRPYVWEGESDPTEGKCPSPLPSWVRDLGSERAPIHQESDGPVIHATRKRLEGAELSRLIAVLDILPNTDREDWLRVGMALHRDVVHEQAIDLWENWSDSGEGAKRFNSEDQMRVWYSFRRTDILQSVGLVDLYEAAKKIGDAKEVAAPAVTQAVTKIGGRTQEDFAEADARANATVNNAPLYINPFPVQSLNKLTAWISKNHSYTHPLASQAAALAIACTAAGRRYKTPAGDPAHIFIGVMVPSVSLGRYATQSVEQVVMQSGFEQMVRAARFTAPKELYGALFRSPSLVYCADDWGDQIHFARRQPSGLLEQVHTLLGNRVHPGVNVLLDSWAELGFKSNSTMNKHRPAIYAPSLTMVAPIAHSSLAGVLRLSELARGAADAMILVPTDEHWLSKPVRAVSDLPENIRERFRLVRGLDPDQTAFDADDLLQNLALQKPTMQQVVFNADIEGVGQVWSNHTAKAPPSMRGLYHGGAANVRRICCALAAWQNPTKPVVDDAILNWANEFMRNCVKATISEIQTVGSDDDGKSDAYESLADYLSRQGPGGAAKRDLPRVSRPYKRLTTEKRDELINKMVIDGAIYEFPTTSGRGTKFVHERYIEKGAIKDA